MLDLAAGCANEFFDRYLQRLRRLGLVAIGRAFEADLRLASLSLY